MTNQTLRFTAIAMLAIAACTRAENDTIDTGAMSMDTGAAATAPTGDVTTGLMTRVEDHARMLDTASTTTFRAHLTMHRSLVDSLLAAMDADVARGGVTLGPEWTATVDSVRQDLDRLETVGESQRRTLAQAHRARLDRLIQIFRSRPPAG